MPDIPDDARPFINSEFVYRLENQDPPRLDVIIETEPGLGEGIAQQLRNVASVSLEGYGAIDGTFIPANVPEEAVADIARLDGVALVHQDTLAGVMEAPQPTLDIPFGTIQEDPLRTQLSEFLFDAFEPRDPYRGRILVGGVEVPRFNFAQLPPGDPLQTAATAADTFAGAGLSGEKLIPTSEAVGWIRDSDLTDGAVSAENKVAILDTGYTPTEPENGGRLPRLESLVPGEPPADMMGHGGWCTNMVTGYEAPGAWGPVAGVAPGSAYGHFKCLNTFPGFGKTSWILKAMERALDWGADVISMSLGGTQQGGVTEDPYCRFIRKNCKENAGDEEGAIFVVAAGNSGPDRYRIGSPGVAPKALTVASWSLTDAAPAVFSSRGPQGEWYEDNREAFNADRKEVGADEFVKPDCCAPGGGRSNQDRSDAEGELLFQSTTGWYDGLRDGLKDNRASMRGTSMATPAVAGLVKRLYDAGIVTTAGEVKQVVRDQGEVDEYPEAASGANATVSGKNIAVGHGPARESLFQPAR